MPQNNHHSRSKKEWLDGTYARSVERVPERDYPFEASDGHVVDPVHAPADQEGWDFLERLGFPGEYPYTRGVQPTMYRGRLWTMRQYAGFGDAEESNQRYRYLLEQGQTGLSVAFDLPTQIGYDSDHPMAEGEVGKVGVAISSLAALGWARPESPRDEGGRPRGRGGRFPLPHPHRLRPGGPGRGPGVRRVRAAALLLLRLVHQPAGGGGEVPGGAEALGAHRQRAVRREGRTLPDAALPHPDRRRPPAGPAAGEQHHPNGHPGPGRRPGRHPVAPYELHGRGAGPAHRESRADRPPDPAGHRLRVRRRRRHRPS